MERGNTVVVIEHNMDIIKCADWVIDLGPEGGDRGGSVVATGTPEEIVRVPESHTGRFLERYLTVVRAGSDDGPAPSGGGIKGSADGRRRAYGR